MKYNTIIYLKNGVSCQLRNAEAADAQEMHDCFNLTHEETDYLTTYPEENSFDEEKERKYLADKEQSVDEVEICAIIDGRIVGSAGFGSLGHKEKIKHRAEFGISIERKYWGLGIGRALTLACIECAKQAGYRQLELDVVADNTAAVALYKSVGFIEYGRNPKGFRSRVTGWQEIILMRLEL